MIRSFPSIGLDELLTTAEHGTILTVNRRLARHLYDQYSENCIANGRKAWRHPLIREWDGWLVELLHELDEDDHLLSTVQEQHLWEQVVSESLSPEQKLQLQVPATARMARDAHRLLVQYGAEIDPRLASDDHRVFLKWREAWVERCAELALMDSSGATQRVEAAFISGQLTVPGEIIVAGFDDLRPDQHSLLKALAGKGCRVNEWSAEGSEAEQQSLVGADDVADEVRRCSRWARRLIEQGAEKIGVVVPEPHVYRSLLEETLLAELSPETLLYGGSTEGLYSFSLGSTLADEGIVSVALHLLSLGDSLTFDELSVLLRSPWVGDLQRESGVRCRLENALRKTGETDWQPRRLQKFNPGGGRSSSERSSGPNYLSGLAGSLSRSLAMRKKKLPASQWDTHFKQFLSECGWPGQRTLSSRDFQAKEEFSELFNELTSLERLGRPIGRSEAIAYMSRRCSEKPFQVREATGVVQVLGLLESTGITFDHLWLLGMHDGAFPAVPRPNPFIPVPLQKSLKMPHADASREMEFASSVAARLFRSAQNLVASFPRTSEGAERSPSPFVTAFSGAPPQLSLSQDPLQHLLNSSPAYDKTADHRAPVIASSKPVSGGTGLIKDQALCPFRAFVRHRLRCEALVSLDIGLDPMQRGNLVHSTLEFFWKDVRDQVKLCGMNPDTREKKMRSAARGAISRFERENRHDLFMDVRVIEEERLVRLGLEWLEVELARAPFVVEEFEADRECTLGRLTIKTKVDRVDRLESGGIAVIDYKTGKPDPLQWLSDRLSEPQLPIYVQEFKEDNIAAVLFAQVRKGECRFRGLASCEDEIPKVPGRKMVEKLSELELDFSAVLERWGKALPQIADDFVSGNALVDPLDGEKTCRYCDYPALCRVTEQKDLKSEGVDG